MFDLSSLYQEMIIDHNRNPRHYHEMPEATVKAEGFNPLCGDRLTLFLKLEHGTIVDASFVGKGCAISTASASMMTDALIGQPINKAQELFNAFHGMVTEGKEAAAEHLGKLASLAGVKDYPSRVKCATLAWHTLNAALNDDQAVVTTE